MAIEGQTLSVNDRQRAARRQHDASQQRSKGVYRRMGKRWKWTVRNCRLNKQITAAKTESTRENKPWPGEETAAHSGAARALATGVKLAVEGPPGRLGPLPKNENLSFLAHFILEGPSRTLEGPF